VVPLDFPSLDSIGVACGPPVGAVFLHLTIGFLALSKDALASLRPPCEPIFPPLLVASFSCSIYFLSPCSTTSTENPQHYPLPEIENESLPPSVISSEIVIKPTSSTNNDIGASTIDHKT
jgi:hypothetical protein